MLDSTKKTIAEAIIAQLPQTLSGDAFERRSTDKTPRYFTTAQQSGITVPFTVENENGEPEELTAQISFCVNLYPERAQGKAVSLNSIQRQFKQGKLTPEQAKRLIVESAEAWAAKL